MASGHAIDTYEEDVTKHLMFLVDYFPNGRQFNDETVYWALGQVKNGDYPKSKRERAKAIAADYAKKDRAEKDEFLEALQGADEEIRSGR